MEKLMMLATAASYYDGPFGGKDGWIAAGMGFVYITGDGSLIVVDGGNVEDGEMLVDTLTSLSGGERARVSLWVLTHPHIDHYGALRTVTESDSLASRVSVDRIMCRFPEQLASLDRHEPFIRNACAMLKTALAVTGAVLVEPDAGFELSVGTARLRVLSVPQIPNSYTGPNSLSLIFSIDGEGERVLFTGDATRERLAEAARRCGALLRSDILQIPHHGLCDSGDIDFYAAVGAHTLLVPICRSGERSMKSGYYKDATAPELYAEAHAQHIYRAYDGNVTLTL